MKRAPSDALEAESKFLQTVYSTLWDKPVVGTDRVETVFLVFLHPRSFLPPHVYMEFLFEKPHTDEPLTLDKEVLLEELHQHRWRDLIVISPPVTGARQGLKYTVVINIYTDAEKQNKIGEHHQLVGRMFFNPYDCGEDSSVSPEGPGVYYH